MPSVPRRIVVDSGPVIALFNGDDSHHERALDFLRETRAELITTMAVITEAMHVLGDSLPARMNLLEWIETGGLTLGEPELADFKRIKELMEKYADLPMDFTDAVVVTLCERLRTNHIASVDRDFTIYRYMGRTHFINEFFP
jgi:predicted nucleic acid-binding protein